MKNLLFVFILFILQPFTTNTSSAQNNMPIITMENQSHDFGTFPISESPSYEFVLKNTGNAVLVLLSVKTTCSCTKIKWPKKPIAIGATEKIEVTYKPTEIGAFYKEIDVYSNTKNKVIHLTIKGFVTK